MVGEAGEEAGVSSAKSEILDRIRRANSDLQAERESEYAAINRRYRQAGSLGPAACLDLFIDRLHDYGATVYRCTESAIPETVAQALTERVKTSVLISQDLPPAWLPDSSRFIRDDQLAYGEIDQSEGVLSDCALAIATTGTIVLHHRAGNARRALSLIPDYHLCVVFATQIVETVAEGIRIMSSFAQEPLTTVSGPSATSDIEMTRIKGVHGPRTLDVILVAE